MKKYTRKERVEAAFEGKFADRVPIATSMLGNVALAELLGYTLKEYYLEPEKAFQVFMKLEEMFPSDSVCPPGDPFLPGAYEAWVEMKYGPGVRPPLLLEDKAALATMKVRDPRAHTAFATYLEMCRRVGSLFPDAWIAPIATGIWSIAAELRGVEPIIYDTVDDPQFVHQLMSYTLELGKARGLALAETGANVVFGDPSASCSLISPRIYREFVKPYHQELFTYMKAKVPPGIKVGLHICGYVDPIMEDIASLPIDWFEMDAPSSLEKMLGLAQGRIVVKGNVPLEALSKGTSEQIEEAVRERLEATRGYPGFILAPGCSMPQDASLENIRAFWEAGQKYGRRQ
jgi:uroporphyrinogen decarboxylase